MEKTQLQSLKRQNLNKNLIEITLIKVQYLAKI